MKRLELTKPCTDIDQLKIFLQEVKDHYYESNNDKLSLDYMYCSKTVKNEGKKISEFTLVFYDKHDKKEAQFFWLKNNYEHLDVILIEKTIVD